MNEYQLLEKINEVIDKNKYCEVDVRNFFNIWNKELGNINDRNFSEKLLKFSNKNYLDYVIVLGPNKAMNIIRFWKPSVPEQITVEEKLLDYKEEWNGQGYNDRIQEQNEEINT